MNSRDKIQNNKLIDKALYEYLIKNKRPLRVDNSLIRFIAIMIGALIIILGYLLFIKGVTGEASISINSKSISGQLLNATPGLFFAIAGVIVIICSLIFREKPNHLKVKRSRRIDDYDDKKKKYIDDIGSVIEKEELDVPTFLRKGKD